MNNTDRGIVMRQTAGDPGPMQSQGHEEALHHSVITALASEIHQPVESVKPVYENELARLKSNAKVKDYLVLLAFRRAREKLLDKRAA